jgi:glycosyltransferase involved in cell wall biosynthesis
VHIALVNQWFPPESGNGGVAIHNYHFTLACSKLGHEVTVIAKRPSREVSVMRSVNGVTVLRIPALSLYRYRRLPSIGRYYHAIGLLAYSWRVCRALRIINEQKPVDIAEFADVNAEGSFWKPGMSRKLAIRCQTPAFVLARYYSQTEAPYEMRLIHCAEKHTIQRSSILLAPTANMAQEINAACGVDLQRFHVIADALDPQLFTPGPRKGTSEKVTVLFVGRLERAKGVEVLAKAIPLVCRQFPNVRFVFIGGDRPRAETGSHRAYLERTLHDQLAAGQVIFRGEVSQDDLIEAYRQADIGVVPSVLYESFSYTCAQPMSCGLPVVASRIGGIPETLAHGECGILVEPGDVQELAAALLRLCEDPVLRHALGDAGRTRTEQVFAPEVVARRNLDVFAQALAS